MLRNAATLRSQSLRAQVESELHGRVASPFAERANGDPELVSSGIAEIDALSGGLPRGALTEIYGPPCSGRMTLLVSALAARTAAAEACALIDVQDTFDPPTAAAAGVALDQLLWVRCKNLDQGLRAADLLLRCGGFGLIAMDMGEIAPKVVRSVPLNVWFRFRRAVENTPMILALFTQEPNATCASLVLRLQAEEARWSSAAMEEGKDFRGASFLRLLESVPLRLALVRSRLPKTARKSVCVFPHGWTAVDAPSSPGRIETRMMWAIPRGEELPSENLDSADSNTDSADLDSEFDSDIHSDRAEFASASS